MTFEQLVSIYNDIQIAPKKRRGTVYHYTSPEGLIGIITNKYLFATDLLYLNDAAEGQYALEVLLDVCKEEFPDQKDLYKGLQGEISGMIKQAPGKYHSYVISCSEKEDLLNMWNYYTKGSSVEGYNIGFDINRLAKSLEIKIDEKSDANSKRRLKVKHGEVNYNIGKQKAEIKEVLHQFVDPLRKENDYVKDQTGTLYYLIVRKVYHIGLFYKAPDYKGEKEYRFIFMPGIVAKNDEWQREGIPYKEDYRNKNGILIPYQKCNFSTDSVVSIMCSPTNDFTRTAASVRRLLSFEFENVQNQIHQSSLKLRY